MVLVSSSQRGGRPTIAAILALLLAACSGGGSAAVSPPAPTDGEGTPTTASPSPSREPEPAVPRIALPVVRGSTVEGLVAVNGHDIYARCAGDGSPTVLYFTGWADDLTKRAVDIASKLEVALGQGVRICSYERRNTGRSDAVGGSQRPEDVIADVDGMLAALGEDGPFVLLGASFGGLVASAYAVAHPDRVAGVVLLDASTGVDYALEEMGGFQGACLPANRELDANESVEKLDNCLFAKWVHDRRDREPAVPLLYLRSRDSPFLSAEGEALIRAWIESWSPGTFRVVSAPHWMDEADPSLVADAVGEVIESIR